MEKFTTILNQRDGHVHLFDSNGVTPLTSHMNCIGFMDIWFPELSNYGGNNSELLYNNYINNHLDTSKSNILLSTAPDPDQVIHIYEGHKNVIKGFGELKCYDYSFAQNTNTPLPFKDLKWVNEICDYNDMGLPTYIHYSLDNNNKHNLIHLLEDYKHIPFVLCHCGVGTKEEYGFSLQGSSDESMNIALDIAEKYDNMYLDISYTAYDVLDDNLSRIFNIGKFILGTDVNNQQFLSETINGKELYRDQLRKFKLYHNVLGLGSEKTMKNLFTY